MNSQAEAFLALHVPGAPLVMPNPWDAGSAKLLASLGFAALATTSGGLAMTLGRLDGSVSRDEALAHAADIVRAVDVPVSADLENLYATSLDDIAVTVRAAFATGLAGLSIEDWDGSRQYSIDEAAERVGAAVEAAHASEGQLIVTARAENYLRDNPDLTDTIARLQAYQTAGADVLYAPFVTELDDIRRIVAEVDRPVNVLAAPGAPPVAALAEVGVARVSVGSALAYVSVAAVLEAAQELRDEGTYGYLERTKTGSAAHRNAVRVGAGS